LGPSKPKVKAIDIPYDLIVVRGLEVEGGGVEGEIE
jgi:hypothetical protein